MNPSDTGRFGSRIRGTGSALPSRVLTNRDLEQIVDTSDDWIVARTGIRERRIAAEGETLCGLASEAVRRALDMAGRKPEDVDLLVCATVTPDWHLPASACFVQAEIGAKKAAAFDLSAGCSGFLYALALADQFLKTGQARTAVVVGAELLSKYIDWKDRSTCVIFADGAGAVVVEREEGDSGILASRMHSAGEMVDLIAIPGGGTRFPPSHEMIDQRLHYIKMKGNETFKLAVRCLVEVADEALESAGLRHEDVSLFIPHQANLRIIDAVGDRLHIARDRIVVNIERTGNTSAASIPIALDEVSRAGRLRQGDVVLMAAFGAGLTWAATVARW